jgi:hypothetical protein
MDPIEVLPDAEILDGREVSNCFLERNIVSFQAACHYVQAMPYGANSHSENALILFAEGQGTCTTKHGVIARLAQELNLPVYKNLGFYRLNDEIVTGVNAILQPYGLNFIPQIHCFLAYENYRVDLTAGNCNGKNKIIEAYDFVVPVQPDLTRQQHQAYYREYLQQYYALAPELTTWNEATLFDLLEACDRQVYYQCSIMVDASAQAVH